MDALAAPPISSRKGISASPLVVGALAAYFGEVFRARATAPEMEWRILRHPFASGGDEGALVLLRPAHVRRGKPRLWVCPLVIVGNMIGSQAAGVDPRHGPRVGYNDPDLLQTLLFMHLQLIGEEVPELEPLAPEPDDDPEGTLLGMLDAPEVAAARAVCPARWVAVPEGLDDEDFTFTTEEVCAGVGFGGDGEEWSLFLDDSIRPVVDVEAPDDQDPLLRVLRAHPRVLEADHADREVYEWSTSGAATEQEMAALALTGLAAAQEQALRRARTPGRE